VILMASHGRRGISAIVLGSETLKVLTHSIIPVIVCTVSRGSVSLSDLLLHKTDLIDVRMWPFIKCGAIRAFE